jgi:hypothetical protein
VKDDVVVVAGLLVCPRPILVPVVVPVLLVVQFVPVVVPDRISKRSGIEWYDRPYLKGTTVSYL